METREMVQSMVGFGGKWESDFLFRVDPLTYGYLIPIEKVEVEFGGIAISSSPITNTQWWTRLMPVASIPSDVEFNQEDVEDGFIELSAGTIQLPDQAQYLEKNFPRLFVFLERSMTMIEKTNKVLSMTLGLNIDQGQIRIQSRLVAETDLFTRNCEAFKKLFTKITNIHGKVDTSTLPPPEDFSGDDLESIIQESKYYALKEAVRLETIDILKYIISKKSGKVDGGNFLLPSDKMHYKMQANRIEAFRAGTYMGQIGFEKGVKQIQQFFATTLGGGRW